MKMNGNEPRQQRWHILWYGRVPAFVACTALQWWCSSLRGTGAARAKIYFWSQSSLFSLYKGRHGRVCSLQTRGETVEVTRVEKETLKSNRMLICINWNQGSFESFVFCNSIGSHSMLDCLRRSCQKMGTFLQNTLFKRWLKLKMLPMKVKVKCYPWNSDT